MTDRQIPQEVKPKTNSLRMPFAQWVAQMREARVTWQARYLAMTVAIYRVEGNAELSMISELEGKTLDKYKKELKTGGWIMPARVGREKGGRGVVFEPIPACAETPVEFTDLVPRKGGKYYPGNEPVDTGVNNTPVTQETPAEIPPVSEPRSPHTPLIGLNNTPTKPASLESDATHGLAGLNGSSEPMISDIVGWMVGGDRQSATNWLMTFLRQYSQEVVREAYLKLKTDIATGQLVSRPLQTWASIAARLKTQPQAKPRQTWDEKNEARRARIRKIAQETEAKLNERRTP